MSVVVLDAVLVPDTPLPGDADLIERFVASRDQTAFAELVDRHGTVVLGVCRRVLHDPHDIDDVFQATFLVLVRDASRLRQRQSLASWLYGVAYRISLRVARKKLRRRETVLVDELLIGDGELEKLADRHDQQLVDIELNALSERYRQPLIMKYLAGQSVDEIATELKTTAGAVEGLLKRGKDELRRRLLQRGITLGMSLVAIQVTQQAAQASATQPLIHSLIHAGRTCKSPLNTNSPDMVSDHAIQLATKEIIAMTTTMKATLGVGLTLAGLVIGMGGTGLDSTHRQGEIMAAQLVTTVSATRPAMESLELATLTADPVPKASDQDSLGELVEEGKLEEVREEEGRSPMAIAGAQKNPSQVDFIAPSLIKLDLTKRGENALKIEQALKQPTDVEFQNLSLIEALRFLKNRHQIDIVIDDAAVEEAGIATDEKQINYVASGITLKSILQLLLEPLQLGYLIDDSVLKITTREKVEKTLETRVYNVGQFRDYTSRELMEIVLLTVEPESWNVQSSRNNQPRNDLDPEQQNVSLAQQLNPGLRVPAGSPRHNLATAPPLGVIRASEKLLIVRHRQQVQDEIVELLSKLR